MWAVGHLSGYRAASIYCQADNESLLEVIYLGHVVWQASARVLSPSGPENNFLRALCTLSLSCGPVTLHQANIFSYFLILCLVLSVYVWRGPGTPAYKALLPTWALGPIHHPSVCRSQVIYMLTLPVITPTQPTHKDTQNGFHTIN